MDSRMRQTRQRGRSRRGKSRRKKPSRGYPLLFCLLFLLLCGTGFVIFSAASGRGSGRDRLMAGSETPASETPAPETGLSETPAPSPETEFLAETVPEETMPEPVESTAAVAEPIELLFGGDVFLSSYVLEAYDQDGISGVLGTGLRKAVEEADLFMVNQELPASDRGEAASDKEFTFRVPPERLGILREMGVDLVTLANNHSLDFGREALTDTLDALKEREILYTGAGRNAAEAAEPVILELKGKRIGFLGASRVAPEITWSAGTERPGLLLAYDPERLLKTVAKMQELCDYTVVYMHWGVEREEEPKEYVRELAHQIVEAGADLVIGAHPHVLQGTEYWKGVPIVYSLGNLVFGSSIPKTMLLKARIEPDTGETVLFVLPAKGALGYTRELEASESPAFYDWYEGLSFDISVSEDGTLVPAGQVAGSE